MDPSSLSKTKIRQMDLRKHGAPPSSRKESFWWRESGKTPNRKKEMQWLCFLTPRPGSSKVSLCFCVCLYINMKAAVWHPTKTVSPLCSTSSTRTRSSCLPRGMVTTWTSFGWATSAKVTLPVGLFVTVLCSYLYTPCWLLAPWKTVKLQGFEDCGVIFKVVGDCVFALR